MRLFKKNIKNELGLFLDLRHGISFPNEDIKQIKVKLVTAVEVNPKAPFQQLQHKGVWKGGTAFPRLLHSTLDPYLIMEGGIKYHLLSLWYDSTWDWTPVFRTIGEHSTHLANTCFLRKITFCVILGKRSRWTFENIVLKHKMQKLNSLQTKNILYLQLWRLRWNKIVFWFKF